MSDDDSDYDNDGHEIDIHREYPKYLNNTDSSSEPSRFSAFKNYFD